MKTVETVDLTPTWEAVLPLLVELYHKSSDARVELTRMARIADDTSRRFATLLENHNELVAALKRAEDALDLAQSIAVGREHDRLKADHDFVRQALRDAEGGAK